MAATTPATSLQDALDILTTNIHSLSESGTFLKTRLTTWRKAFFPLVDQSDVTQAFIHQWIVPNLALENELPTGTLAWYELERVIDLMSRTLSAARWDGYLPAGAQEVAMVAAFNAAWT